MKHDAQKISAYTGFHSTYHLRKVPIHPAILIIALGIVLILSGCPTPIAPSPDDTAPTETADTPQDTTVAVSAVSLDESSVTLTLVTSRQFTATVSPENATDKTVSWTSSNSAVATVSASGLVTTVAAGSATITVTTTDGGKTATCSVTVREPDVYIGGTYNDGTTLQPGFWKNGIWNNLANPYGAEGAAVYGILVHQGDLYVAGYAYDGTRDEPGYWKNGVWNALPAVSSNDSGHVRSIYVSGSDVYAVGVLYNPNTMGWDLVGYWKNGNHTSYQISGSSWDDIVDLFVSGGDVYITGNDNSASPQVGGYWKNGVWTALPAYTSGEDISVKSILVAGGQVIAAGDGYPNPPRAVKWTDGTANAMDSTAPFESQVFDMTYSGEDLYIAGWHNAADDSPDSGTVPCYWKNGNLVLLPKPDVDGLRTGDLQTGTWTAVSGSLVFVAGAIRDNNNGGSVPFIWRNGGKAQLETQPGNLYYYVYGVALY